MSEVKKVKLELPDDIALPNGIELPEIEIASATLKRTVIQEDGKMIEIEEIIELPIVSKD